MRSAIIYHWKQTSIHSLINRLKKQFKAVNIAAWINGQNFSFYITDLIPVQFLCIYICIYIYIHIYIIDFLCKWISNWLLRKLFLASNCITELETFMHVHVCVMPFTILTQFLVCTLAFTDKSVHLMLLWCYSSLSEMGMKMINQSTST